MGPERVVGAETVVVHPRDSRPPAPPGCELVELIGRGGMGEVWKARDVKLGRDVAVKYLYAGAGEPELARFRREAATASRLDHSGVITIHAVGQAQGRSYIVMRLVRGRTLAAWPRDDVRGFVRVVRDAARAVEHAHRQGVLHRDVKPSNVLIEESEGSEPRAVVSDFGLAKWLDGGSRLTLSGQAVGTPPYMPPEQVSGDPVGPTGDVYSLGATLYELLKGRPPFGGDTPLQVMRRVVEEEPEPIDGPLGAVVAKAMEKKPARRYATAAAFADDLDRWLRDERVLAPFQGPLRRLVRRLERRKGWVFGSTAAVLLATLPWLGGSRAEPTRAPADVNEFLLAWVTGRADRLRVAERTLRELEADPRSPASRLWSSRLHRLLGRPGGPEPSPLDQARDVAILGGEIGEGFDDDFLKGAAALRRGDAAGAEEALTRHLGTSAWDGRGYALRARARGARGRWAAAEEDAARAAELAPADPWVALERAEIHRAQRRFAGAEREYTRALMLDPGWAAAAAGRGALYAEEGLVEKAEADLRRAWELDGRDARPLARLADLLREGGRLTEAEATYTRVLNLDPARAEAWRGRARLHAGRRHFAAAEEDYARAIAAEPGDATSRVERARALRALGREAEALEEWRAARELDPRVGPAPDPAAR